jgi:hypothetical protein
MHALQRSRVFRVVAAFLTSALLALAAWRAGAVVMLALLFALLLVVTFALFSAAPDLIAYWRQHDWRWWWRASPDDGPFWPGTRVPRHPR